MLHGNMLYTTYLYYKGYLDLRIKSVVKYKSYIINHQVFTLNKK